MFGFKPHDWMFIETALGLVFIFFVLAAADPSRKKCPKGTTGTPPLCLTASEASKIAPRTAPRSPENTTGLPNQSNETTGIQGFLRNALGGPGVLGELK